MSVGIESLLKDIQNAISARVLYPADHPRTIASLEHITREIQEVMAARAELSVFALEDKVVHDGTALPGSEAIARGLFRTLRLFGFDRMTIKKGVTRVELEQFLAAMGEASKRSDQLVRERVRTLPNIRLTAFKADRPEGSYVMGADEFLREEQQILAGVWSGVVDAGSLDRDGLEGIVLALSKTVEENLGAMIPMAALKSYDEYTATHIINVALLAMGLAEAAGLPAAHVHDVGIAALLHDVGKLQVPSEILNKPDRLTDEEFAAVKRHPEAGARILFSTPGVPEVAVIVAYEHHIRKDGGGYPTVPRKWKRSVASAITQVADIFDALRTDRPYRRGLDRTTIMRIMVGDSGTHFDGELLKLFFERVIPRTTAG